MSRKAEDACVTCGSAEEKLDIDWIDCDVCHSWFHQDCEFLKVPVGTTLTWICFACRKQKVGETSQEKALLADYQRLKEKEAQTERLKEKMAQRRAMQVEADRLRKELSKLENSLHEEENYDSFSQEFEAGSDNESGLSCHKPKEELFQTAKKHVNEVTRPTGATKKLSYQVPSDCNVKNSHQGPFNLKSSQANRNEPLKLEQANDEFVKKSRERAKVDEFSDEDSFSDSVSRTGRSRYSRRPDQDNGLNDVLCQLTKMMVRQNVEPLPDFSGEIDKWPVFYAQYNSARDQLSDEENMQRLRKSIKGDAFKLVKSKLAYSKDPAEIIKKLKSSYASADGTIRNIVMKLRSLRVPDENSASSIRDFKAELDEAYAMLTSLGATKYLSSPTIVDDIVARLPIDMRRYWGYYAKSKLMIDPGDAELKDLVDWMEEYSKWVAFDSSVPSKKKDKPQKSTENRGRVNVHSETSQEEQKCRECSQVGHYLVKCSKFSGLSVDQRWDSVKMKNLCFICLNRRHKKECPRKKQCGTEGCTRFHHPLLHRVESSNKPTEQEKKVEAENNKEASKDKKQEPPKTETNFNGTVDVKDRSMSVFFRIMPVKLLVNGKSKIVNAFFDEGSSQSLLLHDVAKEMGIQGTKEPLSLTWTDNSVKVERDSEIVSFQVAGIHEGSSNFWMRDVRTVSQLNLPKSKLNIQKLQEEFDYLKGITIPQPLEETPCLLIGLKHAKLGLAFEKRERKWEEPIATYTRLGWVVHGCLAGASTDNFCCVVDSVTHDQELNDLVKEYFSLESFGVRASDNHKESLEDIRSKMIFDKTLKKTEKGYEVGLLWKADEIVLPDNREMAIKRFLSFEKQMQRDPEFGRLCKEKFQKGLDKGYFRKLSPKETERKSPRTWYLPMFAVKNVNKPGSVRLVQDAAAEFYGESLNKNLLKGPDNLTSLAGILWISREREILLVTDINDMYNRIGMKVEDQDSQRVVWRDEAIQKIETYVVTVVTFGPTSSPSSAQEVKNKNADRFKEKYPRAVLCIKKRHYVDDAVDSFRSIEEAVQTAKEVTLIHREAGFELKNWTSNSKEVMRQLNGHESQSEELSLEFNSTAMKILGMYWDPAEDVFSFNLNFARVDPDIVSLKRVPTKREVLRLLSSVFDPHGMLVPILVNAKIFLQDVWRQGFEWDEKLSDELFEKWSRCVTQIKGAEVVRVPRCYATDAEVALKIELHTFCDASEYAFAAVSYFRFIFADERIEVAFVAAKSKVAPLKHLSIPRLELQGAVMGTRLAATIIEEHSLKITDKKFWTDSQTVLSWIGSDHRKYKPFVANRVSEVLDHSTMKEWRWIPSKMNVADDGTKHKDDLDMTMNGRWLAGPAFLKLNEEEWKLDTNPKTDINEAEELKVVSVHHELETYYDCIDVTRFSKWSRLVRAVAYAKRFIAVCRKQQERSECLSPDEVKRAEILLLTKIQAESYKAELSSLKQGHRIERTSKLWTLTPILDDDGLIRLRGRIDAAPFVSEEFKRPIILDRKHHLTLMIVQAYHDRFYHGNTETVVAELRQKFWINEIRVAVKQVARNCQYCKIRKSRPKVPEMSPLPEARLIAYEKPFSYVGLDYLGPFMVAIGRRQEKRWVALYTCLVIRAVHLEIVSSLDTSSCIMATRNFMLRRGPAKVIYCDNGTSMHGAESELRRSLEELDRKRLQDEAQWLLPGETRTEWRFIPPLSPHMGGAWERLVKSTKSVLYCCLRDRAPKEEVFRSFLLEAEYTVNSRPLTYQSLETSTQEPLTPNRILQLGGQVVYSPGVFDSKEYARKPWRFSQQLADEFWKRWVKEYLPVLTKRTKWFEEQPDLQVGDVVVIVDESAPRNLWSKGIVQQIVPSKDGKVRSVMVKTEKSVYQRPVAKLARLDVRRDAN